MLSKYIYPFVQNSQTSINVLLSFSDCTGKVVLKTFDDSQKQKEIDSKKIRTNIKKERKKRSIKVKHTDGNLLPFNLATVTGNCRWKVYDRYVGGQNYEMVGAKTYQPRRTIRSLSL